MTICGACKQPDHNVRTCKGRGVQTVDAPQASVSVRPGARAARGGFSVTATITHVVYETSVDGRMQVCYGVDDKGREVVWTFVNDPPNEGDIVDVLGHEIIRYSGEDGPWGRAAEPQETDIPAIGKADWESLDYASEWRREKMEDE